MRRRPVTPRLPAAAPTVSALVVAGLVVAAACGAGDAGDAPETGIAWHQGDVASALSRAEREGRPLLLYWGAAWCPPCQYLEHTVFRRAEFVERSRRFVSVYLDGDSAGAQRLGEELEVHGYPTVLLLDPAGEEITRIPNLPIDEFVRVLDESLARMRPIRAVLAEALAEGAGDPSPSDLHALAFYAWDEDPGLVPPGEGGAVVFRRLHARTPPRLAVERSRFLLQWLRRLVDPPAGEAPRLDEAEASAAAAELERVLADPALARANLTALSDSASRIVTLLHPAPSPRRERLVEVWIRAMRGVAADSSLPHEDRLDALFPVVELWRLGRAAPGSDPPPLPDTLAAYVAERIRAAVEGSDDHAVRHSVWNRINALSRRTGLATEAESLLEATLGETVAPFYYMWLLADHAKRSGRPAEAIEWRRRAYEASTGRATRFESGRYYLATLMELAADETARIEAEARRVLGELLERDDAFANRNREGLERLERDLSAWAGGGRDRSTVVARVRAFVRAACPGFPDSGPGSPRDRCLGFLAEDAVPAPRDGEPPAGAPEADRLYR